MKQSKSILQKSAAFIVLLLTSLSISAQPDRTTVFNIFAQADSDSSISVFWEFKNVTEKNVECFELYRANKPFSTTWELSDSAKIAEIPAQKRSYIDKINDYREYYYAIIVKTSDGEDRILLPSINATVNGIHRKTPKIKKTSITQNTEKEKIYPEGSIREIPLPAIAMIESKPESEYPLKIQSVRAGENLAGKKNDENAKTVLEPYAFEEDLISPESGEDYLLFDTLYRTFAKKKYTEGIAELKDFLSVNHSEQVSNRACFYLGECQYFSGSFREAIMSFLKVQETYPDLCQKWIDSSLDLIDIPDIAD